MNSRLAAAGSSGPTGKTCSAGRPKRSRLVATTRLGVEAHMWPARPAAPSSTCSQLSSTRATGTAASCLETAERALAPGSTMPRAPATALATASWSLPGARTARSTKAARLSSMARSRRRVLPTPPGPTRVTRRCWDRAEPSSASSASRPTKDVGGSAGRCSWRALAAACSQA